MKRKIIAGILVMSMVGSMLVGCGANGGKNKHPIKTVSQCL